MGVVGCIGDFKTRMCCRAICICKVSVATVEQQFCQGQKWKQQGGKTGGSWRGILLRWIGPINLVWAGWVLAAFGYQVGPGV